jgi:hypothetical protein
MDLFQNLKQLQKLDIVCVHDRPFALLNGLRVLVGPNSPGPVEVRNLTDFKLTHFPRLDEELLRTMAQVFPSLTKLKLDSSSSQHQAFHGGLSGRYIRDETLQALVVGFQGKGLKSLSLSDCAKIGDAGFTGLYQLMQIQEQFYCKKVRDLKNYPNHRVLSTLGE